jgi:signal transduction histidine kinase/ActR/RegA family two-component response regulator
MKRPSEYQAQREQLRESIIGLGERSIKKSYYPELQRRIAELERINRELLAEIAERERAQEREKKLEYQLQQSQKMEAIGALAGGIAHDFNNILSAILGYTELAQMNILTQCPQKGCNVTTDLGQVLKAGGRAKELVKQILTFSRQQTFSRIPLQLGEIVREALQLLRASIPSTIDIKENITSFEDMVSADPTQIHQIVMNLGTNAYHAMRETGGTLAVGLTQILLDAETTANKPDIPPGSYLLLEISDTGPGIPQDILDRIFDPYFTTKNKYEGTGLGLAVVHGIVMSHQGYIFVHSPPEQGTSFQIYLPQLIQAEIVPPINLKDDAPHGTGNILLVDDEEVIASLEHRILEQLGYHVTSVTSAEEALRLVTSSPSSFDLVISDMSMPKMNGSELAQKIILLRSDLPVILCTGFSDLINEEKARAMGVRGFFMKPFDHKELARAVNDILEKKERQKEI